MAPARLDANVHGGGENRGKITRRAVARGRRGDCHPWTAHRPQTLDSALKEQTNNKLQLRAKEN
eukprot:10888212-Lingulodinium_polyedra.AAC.1